MNPAKKIKTGIENGDWSLVVEACNELFDWNLEVPKSTRSKINLDSCIQFLQSLNGTVVPMEDDGENIEPQEPIKKTRGRKKEKLVVVTKDSNGDNNMSYYDGSDIPIDPIEKAIVKKAKVGKRERPGYVSKIVECLKCGKEFDSNKVINAYSVREGSEGKLNYCNNCPQGH